jgi:hypothetical protein
MKHHFSRKMGKKNAYWIYPLGSHWLPQTHTNGSPTNWDMIEIRMQIGIAMRTKRQQSLRRKSLRQLFRRATLNLDPEECIIFEK